MTTSDTSASATPTPQAAPEARSRNWGGKRPGAGAPRGNRNAAATNPRRAARALARDPAVHRLLTGFAPAVRALVTLALDHAVEYTLDRESADIEGLDRAAQARAYTRAAASVIPPFLRAVVLAWGPPTLTRRQREAAVARYARLWLGPDIEFAFSELTAQSSFESLDTPPRVRNQVRADR